jgi:hypothetical protein
VFALGGGGSLSHYNGGVWADLERPTWQYTMALWGAAPRDIFVAGDGILRYREGQ